MIPAEYKWDDARAPKWLIRRKKMAALIDLRKERIMAQMNKTGFFSNKRAPRSDAGELDPGLGSEME